MVLLGKQYIYTSDLFSNNSLYPCIRYVVVRASGSYKIRLFSLPKIVFTNVWLPLKRYYFGFVFKFLSKSIEKYSTKYA